MQIILWASNVMIQQGHPECQLKRLISGRSGKWLSRLAVGWFLKRGVNLRRHGHGDTIDVDSVVSSRCELLAHRFLRLTRKGHIDCASSNNPLSLSRIQTPPEVGNVLARLEGAVQGTSID